MKFLSLTAIICLTLSTMSIAVGKPASPVNISYIVTFPEAQAHYAEIEMNLTGLHQPFVDLKMPVWTPGSYLVREFSKNVESFAAESKGKAINSIKIRKNIWRVTTASLSAIKVH